MNSIPDSKALTIYIGNLKQKKSSFSKVNQSLDKYIQNNKNVIYMFLCTFCYFLFVGFLCDTSYLPSSFFILFSDQALYHASTYICFITVVCGLINSLKISTFICCATFSFVSGLILRIINKSTSDLFSCFIKILLFSLIIVAYIYICTEAFSFNNKKQHLFINKFLAKYILKSTIISIAITLIIKLIIFQR